MLRLTVISQTQEESILKVEGSISGADVALLEEEGTRLMGASERLILELKGVKFIDRRGISLLKRWSGNRLELREASVFVHALLEEHGLV
jgi:anti-anti-sigma regulatory factor